MRTLWAIIEKELRVYLTTWTAYVVLVAFFEITAFFFYFLIRDYQAQRLQYVAAKAVAYLDMMNLTDMVVGPLFSYIASFFVFLLPILTMRSFASERRQKTIELLMTVPARPLQIVLGKYLSAVGVMLMMLTATLVFPIMLHFMADGGEVSGF